MLSPWIKFEHVTPNKHEVIEMSGILGMDRDTICGKLCRLWIWLDLNTTDGNVRGDAAALLAFINEECRAENFAETLVKVGWLKVRKRGVFFPNFTRHNGNSAKNRALGRGRASQHRNAATVTKVTPTAHQIREEKIREEKEAAAAAVGSDLDPIVEHGGPFYVAPIRDDRTGVPIEPLTAVQLKVMSHIKGIVQGALKAWQQSFDPLVAAFAKNNSHLISALLALTTEDVTRSEDAATKANKNWGVGWLMNLTAEQKPRQRQDGPRVDMDKHLATWQAGRDAELAKIRQQKEPPCTESATLADDTATGS